MKTPVLVRVSFVALCLIAARHASAATVHVSSIAQLQSAINSAAAGDIILVQNGSYTTSAPITINRVGTAAKPIIIAADTVGGVTIGGTNGFTFSSPAAYVTIEGFAFTHAAAINIPSGTSHCRLSRNIIQLTIPSGSDVSYINISGDDVEIDRNELRNKSTLGEMLDIAGSGSQVARRLWVHHNYFHDFTSPGGNGAETIRWGLSGLSLSTGDGICEYNLFVRCNGENEMISNKSSGNTYCYNTVLDSPGGEISQRHGDNCLYYGNYMRNTAGIRVYGDNHQIFSNYLEGNTIGINMGNGDGDVHNGAPLTSHDRPDNNVVTFNTLINNTTQYQMGGRTGGLGATNTTFANNIIQGGTTAVSISTSAPYTTPTWSGNIIWNTTNVGSIPASGYSNVNPLLAADANGVLHLQSASPAVNSATGTYPAVTFDQDGQARPATGKDIGADELSSAPVTATLLTPADVGPASGGNGTTYSASNGFVNTAFSPSQTGSFVAQFDATPSISPSNVTLSLSQGAQSAYTGLACMVRFNPTGSIDARNGGAFAAASTIPFAAGSTYHFRLTVNVPAHTYSIFVTPPGGSEQTVGANFAFRTEQAGVTALNNFNVDVNATPGGTVTVSPVLIAGGPATVALEAEALTRTSSGATTTVQTDTNSSGGQWISLDGTGTGQFVEFTTPTMGAGTYSVRLSYKTYTTRGILSLKVDGTQVGSTLDQYGTPSTYPSATFGNVTFTSAGTHVVRLSVTGKNASASSFVLSADKFTFVGQ